MAYSSASASAADQAYGLPAGTLEALAGSESSYGAHTDNGVVGGGVGPWQETPGFQTTYGITDTGSADQAGSAFARILAASNGNLSTAYVAWNRGLGGAASGQASAYPTSGPVGQFLQSQGYQQSGAYVASTTTGNLPQGQQGNFFNPGAGQAGGNQSGNLNAPIFQGGQSAAGAGGSAAVAAITQSLSGWWSVIEQGLVAIVGLALVVVALIFLLSESKTVQMSGRALARMAV